MTSGNQDSSHAVRRVLVVGYGRAGSTLARAAASAGLTVVVATSRPAAVEDGMHVVAAIEEAPPVDLALLAVPDRYIPAMGSRCAGVDVGIVAHVSGATPVSILAGCGHLHGSVHPLAVLGPDTTVQGVWAGVGGSTPRVEEVLTGFAAALGMRPFPLPDESRGLYHAAASMASNVPGAALVAAHRMFDHARVPWEAARPLVETLVAAAFSADPTAALTGPVVRGDMVTVAAQREAASAVEPGFGEIVETGARFIESVLETR